MLLSILVVSHNQRDLLERCIESILAQTIPFEYEVIISDDNSSDGTYELAKEYERNFPNIAAYRCDSNDCAPKIILHRSGWNRCNAYKYAKGKYFAHVDADDYFQEGSDIYWKQVELLEKHPECGCCMANLIEVKSGDSIELGKLRHGEGEFQTGQVITSDFFINSVGFIEHSAFVYRRHPEVDLVQLYGKRYDDEIITMHHLQFGNIVCLDDWGYVYVKYPKSITAEMSKTADYIVTWCMALYVPQLIPKWRNVYYRSHLRDILAVVRLARNGYCLQDDNYNAFCDLGLYIYRAFNRKLTIVDRIRLWIIVRYLKFLIRGNIASDSCMSFLYMLLH